MISFPWNESILSIQAFANDVFAYLAYLKYICLQEQTVSFSTWTNLKKIKRRFLSNNQYVRFFKRRMWCFLISCFMFSSLYFGILLSFQKIIYNGTIYRLSLALAHRKDTEKNKNWEFLTKCLECYSLEFLKDAVFCYERIRKCEVNKKKGKKSD